MPEPIKSNRRYMPGLDGLRAVAVLGVVAYHLGITAIPGGYLGVSVFFTLSGYLITDLILTRTGEGTFTLKEFWIARARRLMPALLLMLVVVMAWVTVIGPHQGSDFRLAALGAMFYVNNWWWIVRDISYFAQFDGPSPINHLWSLSVEEQFYIVWPLLVAWGARMIPERAKAVNRPRMALTVLALAAASVAVMLALFHPGTDPSRVYYGTDTRAAELLVGAVLAALWPSQKLRARIVDSARNLIDGVAVAGLAVIVAMFLTVEQSSTFLYRGGFIVLSVAVCAVVASVAHPACRLGRLIGCTPMRWIGARSYGLYLWHFPIIVLTTPGGAGWPGPARAALQVGATFGVTALSWKFFEDPIRHGAIERLWARWRDRPVGRPMPLGRIGIGAIAGTMIVLAPAVAGFAGVGIERGPDNNTEVTKTITGDSEVDTTTTAGSTIAGETTAPASSLDPADPAAVEAAWEAARTSCTSVIHVGDSTSLGLVSKSYIPLESQQISARYSHVGVTTQHYEIAGGRSILEGYKDAPPAKESAQKWRDQGYQGCWVMSMGTMDAAAVGRFETDGGRRRIDTMMKIVGDDPILWINARTIAKTGYWRGEVMPPWNATLLAACASYPNMRIYDWAADEQDDWFSKDKVHNNSIGYINKAKNIAFALAKAFPRGVAAPGVADAAADCLIEI